MEYHDALKEGRRKLGIPAVGLFKIKKDEDSIGFTLEINSRPATVDSSASDAGPTSLYFLYSMAYNALAKQAG